MTSETNTGIGGFIGSAQPNTNNQGGMTTITASGDPVQNKVIMIEQNTGRWTIPLLVMIEGYKNMTLSYF